MSLLLFLLLMTKLSQQSQKDPQNDFVIRLFGVALYIRVLRRQVDPEVRAPAIYDLKVDKPFYRCLF